jgi:hypothetical protein
MQTSTVGTFSGCSGVIDLAIDENQNAVVTTMDGLYKLDLATAACTRIANGSYPNSLSFLPKGVLDPDREVLVGYNGSSYVRIDVATGAATVVGALQGNLMSSGDIVSVKDGGTFLTVTGPNCSDCVIQVDPRTGQMLKNLGPIPYASVWGLAYWGGSLYGFTDGGKVFRVSAQGDGIVTTPVALPPGPAGIRFWGAGSSTVVPVKDSNGAGLPIVIR